MTTAKLQWEQTALFLTLQRFPERKPAFETDSGIAVERIYTAEDTANLNAEEALGLPGQYPFTRGVQPTMYRGRFWTMRQYAGYASAEESNKRYRYLLEQGQTGLSVAFDLPTQMGYDPDHALAEGEVGKVGVSIASLDDMATLFDGIPLDKVSTSMTINSTAAILLAFYVAVGRKQGIDIKTISGTTQNDILKEYVARGTYIYPPRPSLRLVTDIFAYCSANLPEWNTISISGYHIREAGSTAVQEVAFTMADAICYVEAAIAAGLAVDTFGPRLSFFFNAHNNFFEEIAKYRAARRMWARIMKERFGSKDARSQMLRFHTQTAGSSLTAQQTSNNVVRVAMQALAAALGGTQSLHTNSFDEALGLPTEESVLLALRTQQVIAYETGIADTIDPLAGSYFVESLTDQIEQKANDYIARIDKMGGALRAIEAGFIQREIQDAAYRYQRSIESGDRVIVGVNRFQVKQDKQPKILRVDPALREQQMARLQAMKVRRDNEKVSNSLAALLSAARGSANLMPLIIDCAENYATLGEISDTLRSVFGEYREATIA